MSTEYAFALIKAVENAAHLAGRMNREKTWIEVVSGIRIKSQTRLAFLYGYGTFLPLRSLGRPAKSAKLALEPFSPSILGIFRGQSHIARRRNVFLINQRVSPGEKTVRVEGRLA